MIKNTKESLWKRYDIDSKTGCFVYRNVNKGTGYGEIMINYKKYLVHRLAYEIKKGEIPPGLQIDHLCKNRACINVDHLEVVTLKENVLRGDSWSGINYRKTHCKNGHKFDEHNTIKRKSGGRLCRSCRDRIRRNNYIKNREARIKYARAYRKALI